MFSQISIHQDNLLELLELVGGVNLVLPKLKELDEAGCRYDSFDDLCHRVYDDELSPLLLYFSAGTLFGSAEDGNQVRLACKHCFNALCPSCTTDMDTVSLWAVDSFERIRSS